MDISWSLLSKMIGERKWMSFLCFCGQTHHQNHPEPKNPVLIRFSFHSILFICRVESEFVDAQAMLRRSASRTVDWRQRVWCSPGTVHVARAR
jgi:hypothetical protein